jgi:hypothetical protein
MAKLLLFSLKNILEEKWNHFLRVALLVAIGTLFFYLIKENIDQNINNFKKENFIPNGSYIFHKFDKTLISTNELNDLQKLFDEYDYTVEKYSLYSLFSGIVRKEGLNWNFIGLGIDTKRNNEIINFDSNISLQDLQGVAISETLKEQLVQTDGDLKFFVISHDIETEKDEINSLSFPIETIFKDELNRPIVILPTEISDPLLESGLANRGILKLFSTERLPEIKKRMNEIGFKIIEVEKDFSYSKYIYIFFGLILIFSTLLAKSWERREWLATYYGWKRSQLFLLNFFESIFATLPIFILLSISALFLGVPILESSIVISSISTTYLFSQLLKS